MKKYLFYFALVLGGLAALVTLPSFAGAQDGGTQISVTDEISDPVTAFQAAGPTTASIQSSVDQYRATVGAPNNGNGPSAVAGRREINWDGGSTTNDTTAVAGNPFSGFLITRGALFTTPDGTGFVQAPASSNVAPGGLAGLFANPTYKTSFRAFSALRLFSAIG